VLKFYFKLAFVVGFLPLAFFCNDCSAKRMKSNIYTVLEEEVPPSKFDQEGFYKQSFDELSLYLNQHLSSAYSGGYYCMSQKPESAGHIVTSNSKNDAFSKEDIVEIEVKDAVAGCSKGTKYIVIERQATGIYKILAEMEATDKAVDVKRCVAKFNQLYDVVRRDAEVAFPIYSGSMQIKQIKEIVTGKVQNIWGDRVCIKFASGQTLPEAGTIVYFYQIKDPKNGKEVDPFVVAKGQLIYVGGQYGTAVINSSGRSVLNGTPVTTRF